MMPRALTAPRPEDGFTIIELLVALSLLAFMLVVIDGALRFGRRAWAVSDAVEQVQSVDTVRSLISQRLVETLPVTISEQSGLLRVAFQGTSDEVGFVTPFPSRNGLPAGLFLATLRLVPRPGQTRQALSFDLRPILAAGEPPMSDGHTPILIDNVEQLVVSYYGQPERGGEPRWFDEWRGRSSLPRAVTVDVRFPPGDRRTWPPLVAELKLRVSAP